MNKKLDGRPLQVMAADSAVPAAQAQNSCQVLKLILAPLHLDLLGLNVDLYGKTKADPVVVTIDALPGQGVLGDLLCSLAGGPNLTSLSGLQNVLAGLGATISPASLQNLLNSLGLNLASGITSAGLQQILQALGLGSVAPPAG